MGGVESGSSREPIHSHNQNQNQNEKGCGNPATMLPEGDQADFCGAALYDGDENQSDDGPALFSDARHADIAFDGTDGFSGKDFSAGVKDGRGADVAQTGEDASGKTKKDCVSLAKAMREAGIVAAPGDPRLMELARQGVDVDTVVAACSEARRARPYERIGMAYVVKIVERWARDANSIEVRGARAHGRVCVHEQRTKALNELTGRQPNGMAPFVSGVPFTLDGAVTMIGEDDGEK